MSTNLPLFASTAHQPLPLPPFPPPAPAFQPLPADVSLSSRAMLCALSISMWSARKHDPDVSEEIASLHNAASDAGRYSKLLLPKKALEEIIKISGEARKEHCFMTLPWDDDGYRVLPADAYMDHRDKMRQLSNRYDAAVNRFMDQIEDYVRDAKRRLGTLFRLDDYPGMSQEGPLMKLVRPNELRSKFAFETQVRPLPDANDFRVQLGNDEKERVKKQITASVHASLQVATRDLWQRLYEAVSHMSERLQAYKVVDDKVEHPFRDTIVTNLIKLVDVLPKLNVAKDADLDRLTQQVRKSLLVDPEELRKSQSFRTDTAAAAASIANQMAGYMSGYSVSTK